MYNYRLPPPYVTDTTIDLLTGLYREHRAANEYEQSGKIRSVLRSWGILVSNDAAGKVHWHWSWIDKGEK